MVMVCEERRIDMLDTLRSEGFRLDSIAVSGMILAPMTEMFITLVTGVVRSRPIAVDF